MESFDSLVRRCSRSPKTGDFTKKYPEMVFLLHEFFFSFKVIRNSQGVVELELHPLSIKLLKHQTVPRQANPVPTVVNKLKYF